MIESNRSRALGSLRASAWLLCMAAGLAAPAPAQQVERGVVTLATTDTSGRYGRVDLVDGGLPPGDPGAQTGDHPARRAFFEQLTSFELDPFSGQALSVGRDLDGDLLDSDGDGVPDAGFDSYAVGLAPDDGTAAHRRVLGANNLYDLLQTTLGPADASALSSAGFAGFTGGDADGDGNDDGGPGLFSNGAGSLVPRLPLLPPVMGGARGGQPGEQHQFVQIVFPYALDVDSLFDLGNPAHSYLADALRIEARWVELGSDGVSVVDQTGQHRHVSGVAIIGGLTALPAAPGARLRATVDGSDPALSGIPLGARQRIYDANVLTFIAHEDPAALVTARDGAPGGFIDSDATLRLPAADRGPVGGRVFGANGAVPDAVNDYLLSGSTDAAPMGFVSLKIRSLRKADGTLVPDAYFHSFSVSQAAVGADPRAPAGGFDRGPALEVDALTQLPAIEALDVLDPGAPGVAAVSTRTRFVVRFDREVVPDSVGFSRRHTLQRVDGLGVVLPFNGNTAPLASAASEFVPGVQGVPVAPSVYLAVNQVAQVAVNNPFVKDIDGDGLLDDGVTPIDAAATTPAQQAALNGLHPLAANLGASLPRGVVPCDVYPLNQDNLQAYVVEPLIELPAGTTVTLGVCRQGLGTTALGLTNVGNYTVAGVVRSPFGGLGAVGVPDATVDLSVVEANRAVVKVNAGPMDLHGRLFTGSTDVVLDTRLDGDPGNDESSGGFNVSRTFEVGHDASQAFVNAPVSPEALYTAFEGGGAGVVDLNGRGFTTNAPSGSLSNPELPFGAIVSRNLPPAVSGLPELQNWKPAGSLAGGDHVQAFGQLARHATGQCVCLGLSVESEGAVAAAVPTGPFTPTAGVNEGSSGVESFVRDSDGSARLSGPTLGQVGDLAVGASLDAILFDGSNPFATVANHRSFSGNGPLSANVVSDPPTPNPPPLTLPVGLPLTEVRFDQEDLLAPPRLIEGAEVFTADDVVAYDDGSGAEPLVSLPVDGWIHLATTADPGNPNAFDVPAALPSGGFGKQFLQAGPMHRDSPSAADVLALAAAEGVPHLSVGGVRPPTYRSRQQIGNLLFATDRERDELVVLNSNTFRRLGSLPLPDPNGLGLHPNQDLLYVGNTADDSLSVVQADPRSAGFLTELGRIAVGQGPTAVVVAPEGGDVFVCDTAGNTITIVDVTTFAVRKTLTSPLLDEPVDLCFGMREGAMGQPGFASGTYHGFIANRGGDNVAVYQSGPTGEAGLGFDDIVGQVATESVFGQFGALLEPVALVFDPVAPLDAFQDTVGCFVLHRDESGQAVVSRVAYAFDDQPGETVVDTTQQRPAFQGQHFVVSQRYETGAEGAPLDLALPDFDRNALWFNEFSPAFPYLYNAALAHPPGQRTPVAQDPTTGQFIPRWRPGCLYVSVAGAGLTVFDLWSGTVLSAGPSPADSTVLTSYFAQ